MRKAFASAMLLALILSGCAWFQSADEESSEDLVGDGMYHYENGSYRKAINAFEKLKDWYPYSKYAILAELKIADAHYRLEEYDEAIAAYESFERLHPRNEAIPYVIFQIGNCYFERIDSVDRDQSVAEKAMAVYARLVNQFPDDEYAIKARENIKICQKSLAGHEFYVGMFYYKAAHYRPALKRFKSVLANYPDVGIHQKALQYITLCEQALGENPEESEVAETEEALDPAGDSGWLVY
jgi:outer membrane protein assembly factor BamD